MIKQDFNPNCITYGQMSLIFNSRTYYRRLTNWTRAYAFSRFYGVGTAEDMFARLYFETLDLGNMLQIVFGRTYAEGYTNLLSQFPIIYRDLLTTMLEGDMEAIQINLDRLYENIEDRAAYLASINPYWSEEEYEDLFVTYVDLIIQGTNAVLLGDFTQDIRIADLLNAHTDRMGDSFARGLYQFITTGSLDSNGQPRQSDVPCITLEQMNAIYSIRMFWFQLMTWIRYYMLSRYMGIGNTDEIFTRLEGVITEYTQSLIPFFGEEMATASLQALSIYLDLIVAFITAHIDGNVEELNRITQLLYENADVRAEIIASGNPFWDEAEWRKRLVQNLQGTIDMSTTFLAGDYTANIDVYTRLIDLAESTGVYFTEGLFNYAATSR